MNFEASWVPYPAVPIQAASYSSTKPSSASKLARSFLVDASSIHLLVLGGLYTSNIEGLPALVWEVRWER